MKKDTKQEILVTAKQLFNERGYNNVSTQNIADALGISKGNLNYHFKRKEYIIEAIVEEMHSNYTKPKAPASLEELNGLFIRAQKVAKENAFYFWHYTQLAQMSERIKEIQNIVIANQKKLFTEAFRVLYKDNMIKGEEYKGQYEQVIQVVTLTCIYWTPHSKLVDDTNFNSNFIECVWAVLYPLLTDAGKSELKTFKNDSL